MKNFLLTFPFAFIISSIATAQSGTLDQTFGVNGTLTTDIGASNERAHAVAIQSDGKIVVAGETYSNSTVQEDFALIRYNTDGTLDATFGTNGSVITDIQQNSDAAKAIAIQTDGKIVVAGHAHNGANYDFAVARYLSNGMLDNTFGTNGKVIKNFGSTDFGLAMVLLGSGKILVSGRVYNGSNGDFGLLQLNSNGSFDSSFGTNGALKSDLFGTDESANALAVQTDGKIIVVGDSYANNVSTFAVARYNPDGTFDPTFSGDGKLSTSIGTLSDVAYAVGIQSDAKIVVAGQSNTVAISDFALARYLPDGTPDNAFSTDGQLTTSVSDGGDYAFTLAIQPDGKILAGGSAASTSVSDFAIVRYLSDGSPDATFGNNGFGLANFTGGQAVAHAMVMKQNKIVVAGYAESNGQSTFAVARFISNSNASAATIPSLESGSLRVSPNPVQELTCLEFTLLEADNIQVQLFDLQGKRLKSYWQGATLPLGKQRLEIHVPPQLPSGTYLLRLQSSKGSTAVKLTKG